MILVSAEGSSIVFGRKFLEFEVEEQAAINIARNKPITLCFIFNSISSICGELVRQQAFLLKLRKYLLEKQEVRLEKF